MDFSVDARVICKFESAIRLILQVQTVINKTNVGIKAFLGFRSRRIFRKCTARQGAEHAYGGK